MSALNIIIQLITCTVFLLINAPALIDAPPSIFWLVTFFFRQKLQLKLQLNPSFRADDIEPEVCYVNK